MDVGDLSAILAVRNALLRMKGPEAGFSLAGLLLTLVAFEYCLRKFLKHLTSKNLLHSAASVSFVGIVLSSF
jgi:hypothetical protein